MEKLPNEGWTKVRRGRYQSKQAREAVTTYFVSNASKETTKGEMKKVFAKFGKLIDVYMGTKVGRNGQHYAFIRFVVVEDAGELERRMNGTNIRGRKLEVNIAKHERKAPPPPLLNTTRNPKPVLFPNSNQSRQGNSSLRDHRTFAEMEEETWHWLWKTSLIGKAKSLEHLGHMPKLLKSGKKIQMSIKYIGGLNVLIEFGCSMEAKEFLANGDRWKEYLRWLQWGEHTNHWHGRIAWIRIVGLPMNLWGERNFDAITKAFGRTIAPFDKFKTRVDLSHVKIGILIDRRTRINEKILVSINGEVLTIGVTEFDEDWYPFKFDTTKNFYVDEYGNEIIMETAVDTNWNSSSPAKTGNQHMEETVLEDGEIPPENEKAQTPMEDTMEQEQEQQNEMNPADQNSAQEETAGTKAGGSPATENRQVISEEATMDDQQAHREPPQTTHEDASPPRKMIALTPNGYIPTSINEFETPTRPAPVTRFEILTDYPVGVSDLSHPHYILTRITRPFSNVETDTNRWAKGRES
ncbi:hypothetical protein LXL04_007387 [Taraxacum kok-saghyz]